MNVHPLRQLRGFALFKSVVPRGIALFLGLFSVFNLAGRLRASRFDETLTWLDLRFLPGPIAVGLVEVSSICLIAFALRPPRSKWRRIVTGGCVTGLIMVSVWNALVFYLLIAGGSLNARFPLPLSALVACGLGMILKRIVAESHPVAVPTSVRHWTVLLRPKREMPGSGLREALTIGAIALACATLFPLAEMFCFGETDYRRPADAAVVLGARVYADGHPSDALADRVRTGCRLYRDGLARKLIFSGGPGDGAVHETEAMKRMAIGLGVKPEDILVDDQGVNTRATARNTEVMFAKIHAERILVVSHFYHLPRIKLAYHRRGREVFTVPAKESYVLRQLPYNMAREVAAFWSYYLRAG